MKKTTASLEKQFARDLRHIAREIGRIVRGHSPTDLPGSSRLSDALRKYSEILSPWAKLKAKTILDQVNRQNQTAWAKETKELSRDIRKEIKDSDVSAAFQQLMAEQVKLIKSMPLEAAERVHKLIIENIDTQGRASELADEIKRTGSVTESRATLIARTEVARAAAVLTQVRAESIGSDGYIWRTAHDGDVRPSHKKMEGKFVKWDSPPTLDNLTGHAGALPNCRCFAEPVLPKEIR